MVDLFKENSHDMPNPAMNAEALRFAHVLRQMAIDEEFEKRVSGINIVRSHLAAQAIEGWVSLEDVNYILDQYLEAEI